MDTNQSAPPAISGSTPPNPESPPPIPPAPRPLDESPLLDVFVGHDGLYPGARWLIYLLMGIALFVFFGAIQHFLREAHLNRYLLQLAAELEPMLAAVLPGFAMARIEGRPFGDFGLPTRSAFGRNFWVGALWGFGFVTFLMLILRVAGAFEFGSLALHRSRIAKFAAYYALYFLFVGFFEEFLFRGYSLWVLSKGMNFWPAAALLSFGFGAIHSHNPGEGMIGLVAAALIGFFFCLTLRRTGSLWWAVGFHMTWDWGLSYLYSVPDSGEVSPGHLLNSSFHGPAWLTGGPIGPEGSVLVFIVIAIMWVVFDRMYPHIKYSD